MKTILLLFSILSFLFYVSFSQYVLSITLEIYKNDSIKIEEIKVRPGNPTAIEIPGNYKLQILDKNKRIINETKFRAIFYILSDPPTPTNSAYFHVRFLYDKNVEYKYLKIYKDEREIFSTEFSLCNLNGICEEYESYLSCPTDCPLNKKDGVCIKEKDGVCDPDCLLGIDLDCIEEKQKEKQKICLNIKDGICEEDCEEDPDCIIEGSRIPIAPLLLFFVIILSAFLFFYFYRRAKYIKRL